MLYEFFIPLILIHPNYDNSNLYVVQYMFDNTFYQQFADAITRPAVSNTNHIYSQTTTSLTFRLTLLVMFWGSTKVLNKISNGEG